MLSSPPPVSYFQGLNQFLLRAIPSHVSTVLEIGCAEGLLGAQLKKLNPQAKVLGVECRPEIAARAKDRLDHVFCLDVETHVPPLELGSIDCLLLGDVLEHLVWPEEFLIRYRRFLKPDGFILCSIPNAQHHSLLRALLTGDFQYSREGLLDATHLRFFTYSTIFKLLLDAGFAPQIVDIISVPGPEDFLTAAEPLLSHLGLNRNRTRQYLNAYQYIVKGAPIPYYEEESAHGELASSNPMTFIVCISNQASLEANLLQSPCLRPGSSYQVILVRDCQSAAEGLNRGLAAAQNDLVVCLHQDVYLPRGWPSRFERELRAAQAAFGPLGVIGVYGVRCRNGNVTRLGHVVDRDRLLKEEEKLPACVDTLDELLLAVHKKDNLRFDSRMGFHFYGADLCLSARQKGLPAVVVDALCYHNSPHAGLSPEFFVSGRAFTAKWLTSLPVATSCALVDRDAGIVTI